MAAGVISPDTGISRGPANPNRAAAAPRSGERQGWGPRAIAQRINTWRQTTQTKVAETVRQKAAAFQEWRSARAARAQEAKLTREQMRARQAAEAGITETQAQSTEYTAQMEAQVQGEVQAVRAGSATADLLNTLQTTGASNVAEQISTLIGQISQESTGQPTTQQQDQLNRLLNMGGVRQALEAINATRSAGDQLTIEDVTADITTTAERAHQDAKVARVVSRRVDTEIQQQRTNVIDSIKARLQNISRTIDTKAILQKLEQFARNKTVEQVLKYSSYLALAATAAAFFVPPLSPFATVYLLAYSGIGTPLKIAQVLGRGSNYVHDAEEASYYGTSLSGSERDKRIMQNIQNRTRHMHSIYEGQINPHTGQREQSFQELFDKCFQNNPDGSYTLRSTFDESDLRSLRSIVEAANQFESEHEGRRAFSTRNAPKESSITNGSQLDNARQAIMTQAEARNIHADGQEVNTRVNQLNSQLAEDRKGTVSRTVGQAAGIAALRWGGATAGALTLMKTGDIHAALESAMQSSIGGRLEHATTAINAPEIPHPTEVNIEGHHFNGFPEGTTYDANAHVMSIDGVPIAHDVQIHDNILSYHAGATGIDTPEHTINLLDTNHLNINQMMDSQFTDNHLIVDPNQHGVHLDVVKMPDGHEAFVAKGELNQNFTTFKDGIPSENFQMPMQDLNEMNLHSVITGDAIHSGIIIDPANHNDVFSQYLAGSHNALSPADYAQFHLQHPELPMSSDVLGQTGNNVFSNQVGIVDANNHLIASNHNWDTGLHLTNTEARVDTPYASGSNITDHVLNSYKTDTISAIKDNALNQTSLTANDNVAQHFVETQLNTSQQEWTAIGQEIGHAHNWGDAVHILTGHGFTSVQSSALLVMMLQNPKLPYGGAVLKGNLGPDQAALKSLKVAALLSLPLGWAGIPLAFGPNRLIGVATGIAGAIRANQNPLGGAARGWSAGAATNVFAASNAGFTAGGQKPPSAAGATTTPSATGIPTGNPANWTGRFNINNAAARVGTTPDQFRTVMTAVEAALRSGVDPDHVEALARAIAVNLPYNPPQGPITISKDLVQAMAIRARVDLRNTPRDLSTPSNADNLQRYGQAIAMAFGTQQEIVQGRTPIEARNTAIQRLHDTYGGTTLSTPQTLSLAFTLEHAFVPLGRGAEALNAITQTHADITAEGRMTGIAAVCIGNARGAYRFTPFNTVPIPLRQTQMDTAVAEALRTIHVGGGDPTPQELAQLIQVIQNNLNNTNRVDHNTAVRSGQIRAAFNTNYPIPVGPATTRDQERAAGYRAAAEAGLNAVGFDNITKVTRGIRAAAGYNGTILTRTYDQVNNTEWVEAIQSLASVTGMNQDDVLNIFETELQTFRTYQINTLHVAPINPAQIRQEVKILLNPYHDAQEVFDGTGLTTAEIAAMDPFLKTIGIDGVAACKAAMDALAAQPAPAGFTDAAHFYREARRAIVSAVANPGAVPPVSIAEARALALEQFTLNQQYQFRQYITVTHAIGAQDILNDLRTNFNIDPSATNAAGIRLNLVHRIMTALPDDAARSRFVTNLLSVAPPPTTSIEVARLIESAMPVATFEEALTRAGITAAERPALVNAAKDLNLIEPTDDFAALVAKFNTRGLTAAELSTLAQDLRGPAGGPIPSMPDRAGMMEERIAPEQHALRAELTAIATVLGLTPDQVATNILTEMNTAGFNNLTRPLNIRNMENVAWIYRYVTNVRGVRTFPTGLTGTVDDVLRRLNVDIPYADVREAVSREQRINPITFATVGATLTFVDRIRTQLSTVRDLNRDIRRNIIDNTTLAVNVRVATAVFIDRSGTEEQRAQRGFDAGNRIIPGHITTNTDAIAIAGAIREAMVASGVPTPETAINAGAAAAGLATEQRAAVAASVGNDLNQIIATIFPAGGTPPTTNDFITVAQGAGAGGLTITQAEVRPLVTAGTVNMTQGAAMITAANPTAAGVDAAMALAGNNVADAVATAQGILAARPATTLAEIDHGINATITAFDQRAQIATTVTRNFGDILTALSPTTDADFIATAQGAIAGGIPTSDIATAIESRVTAGTTTITQATAMITTIDPTVTGVQEAFRIGAANPVDVATGIRAARTAAGAPPALTAIPLTDIDAAARAASVITNHDRAQVLAIIQPNFEQVVTTMNSHAALSTADLIEVARGATDHTTLTVAAVETEAASMATATTITYEQAAAVITTLNNATAAFTQLSGHATEVAAGIRATGITDARTIDTAAQAARRITSERVDIILADPATAGNASTARVEQVFDIIAPTTSAEAQDIISSIRTGITGISVADILSGFTPTSRHNDASVAIIATLHPNQTDHAVRAQAALQDWQISNAAPSTGPGSDEERIKNILTSAPISLNANEVNRAWDSVFFSSP